MLSSSPSMSSSPRTFVFAREKSVPCIRCVLDGGLRSATDTDCRISYNLCEDRDTYTHTNTLVHVSRLLNTHSDGWVRTRNVGPKRRDGGWMCLSASQSRYLCGVQSAQQCRTIVNGDAIVVRDREFMRSLAVPIRNTHTHTHESYECLILYLFVSPSAFATLKREIKTGLQWKCNAYFCKRKLY